MAAYRTCRYLRRNNQQCDRPALIQGEADIYICAHHMQAVIQMYNDARAAFATPDEDDKKRIAKHDAIAEQMKREQCVVYYVRMANYIKIGTTRAMQERMAELRVAAIDGEVLATEPGSFQLERIRHRQFAHLRKGQTEMFRPEDDLLAHIAAIRKRHGEPVTDTRYNPTVPLTAY